MIGAVYGSFVGALNIWFYEFSPGWLLASVSGGACFFAALGLIVMYFEQRDLKAVMAGGLAGCVAGIIWWAVAQPSTSALLAVVIGLVSGAVYVWVESDG